MCATVDQSQHAQAILGRFKHVDLPPRREVYPRQKLGILRENDARNLETSVAIWGLVPAGAAEDFNKKWATYNSRAETVATKPTFADAFKTRRCAIPVDGFFEWTDRLPKEQQYRVAVYGIEEPALWLAGLWALHPTVGLSCTVVTTEPNDLIGQVHSRMPVILENTSVEQWIKAGDQSFFKSYPSSRLAMLKDRPGLAAEDVRASQRALNYAKDYGFKVGAAMAKDGLRTGMAAARSEGKSETKAGATR